MKQSVFQTENHCKTHWNKRLSIYVIFGELEILKEKGLLSDNNTVKGLRLYTKTPGLHFHF